MMANSMYIPAHYRQALDVLRGRDEHTVDAWTKVASDSLRSGVNPKMFGTAAARLDVPVSAVRDATEALMYILDEAARLQFVTADLKSLLDAEFADVEHLAASVTTTYDLLGEHLRRVHSDRRDTPRYAGARWRIDAIVATRAARDQCRPTVHVELALRDDDDTTKHSLDCSALMLRTFINELERAVAHGRSRQLAQAKRAANAAQTN